MAAEQRPLRKSESLIDKIHRNPNLAFAFALLFADAVLLALIIAYVPYTKIDWDAYMSQVTGFLEGERDYRKLEGDTGPLVYPAGFLYIYSAIKFLTGGQVYAAQILFGLLYIANLGIILFIYVKTDVPSWIGNTCPYTMHTSADLTELIQWRWGPTHQETGSDRELKLKAR